MAKFLVLNDFNGEYLLSLDAVAMIRNDDGQTKFYLHNGSVVTGRITADEVFKLLQGENQILMSQIGTEVGFPETIMGIP